MFRFTIRDVLWLTVVVAVCLGWWLSYRSTRAEMASLRHETLAYRSDAQSATAQFFNLLQQYERSVPGSVELKSDGVVTVRTGERQYVIFNPDIKYVRLPAGWPNAPATPPAAAPSAPKNGGSKKASG